MNPNIVIDANQTDARAFVAADRHDSRFFIEGGLRTVGSEHVLSFIVMARLFDGTRGTVRRIDFFTAMMDHLGDDNVDVIEGQWEDQNPEWGTNLEAFNNLLRTNPSLDELGAAARVPTGIYAIRRGYSHLTIKTLEPKHARGFYKDVLVEFRK